MWKKFSSSIFSFFLFALAALAQSAPQTEVSSCAKNLVSSASAFLGGTGFGGECIKVHSDFRNNLGPLGRHIYRIDSCLNEPKEIAWFYVSDGNCTLLSGNIPLFVNGQFPLSVAEDYALSEMNRLLFEFPEIRPRVLDPIEYAVAFLKVSRPYRSQRLIQRIQDIPCNQKTARRDKRIFKKLSNLLTTPKIISSQKVILVNLYLWSDPGGVLEKCQILLWPDGRISLDSDVLASGIGAYSAQVFIPRNSQNM